MVNYQVPTAFSIRDKIGSQVTVSEVLFPVRHKKMMKKVKVGLHLKIVYLQLRS